MHSLRRIALLLFSLFSLLVPLAAQDWRVESIPSLGIAFDAPSRLERLPLQLGDSGPYQRARLRPKDNQDFVRAQYYWYADVYEFSSKATDESGPGVPDGVPPEVAEQLKKMMADLGDKRAKTFRDWLAEQAKKGEDGAITYVVEGKLKKGKGGKLDYQHWVWLNRNNFGPAQTVYCEAAVYVSEGREVALVIEMPLETLKPPVPKQKWRTIIDRMIDSGTTVSADSGADDNAKKDRFADTEDKKTALAAAKKNIEGMSGWDYFTQPNYIVIYSWDFEKADMRKKALAEARGYAEKLERMRELYLKAYPLDETGTKAIFPDPKSIPPLTGPTTGGKSDAEAEEDAEREANKDKLGKVRYSVFRLCATYEQFQKYGQSPPGVVGWFSPGSKELVVFLGGDKMMGQGATETVTYHEGWHQYADFYFDHPQTARPGSLHRWFDEGHGDYFGSFRWVNNGWKYVGSKMRYDDCKQMVRAGDYVPFKEIVHWDRRRFYAANAPYYYAQAYSMIDFFLRAQKEKGWQPRYGEVLDLYRKVMLVHGSAKLASDTAFRDFKAEDWKALEEMWKAWVKGPNFLGGK